MKILRMQARFLDELVVENGEQVPFEPVGQPFEIIYHALETSEDISRRLGKKAPARANSYVMSNGEEIKENKGNRLLLYILRHLRHINHDYNCRARVQLYHIPESEAAKLQSEE